MLTMMNKTRLKFWGCIQNHWHCSEVFKVTIYFLTLIKLWDTHKTAVEYEKHDNNCYDKNSFKIYILSFCRLMFFGGVVLVFSHKYRVKKRNTGFCFNSLWTTAVLHSFVYVYLPNSVNIPSNTNFWPGSVWQRRMNWTNVVEPCWATSSLQMKPCPLNWLSPQCILQAITLLFLMVYFWCWAHIRLYATNFSTIFLLTK